MGLKLWAAEKAAQAVAVPGVSQGWIVVKAIVSVLGGIRACIDPMIVTASRTIGATIVDLLTRPDVLQAAKDEFIERTGGGVGGSKWMAPLLPKDFRAPIDYRWPEYISTVRGEEWWIPASVDD